MRIAGLIGLVAGLLACAALFGCRSSQQNIGTAGSAVEKNGPIIEPKATASIADRDVLDRAVENLRNDDVKWNCHGAMYYLYRRREEIWPFLVDNLGIDDLQARDAIIRILCETKSFEPDAGFIRLVMDRIDKRGGLISLEAHHSTHYDFIAYLAMQAPRFHIVISEGIDTRNPFLLFAVTYALFESGTLGEHLDDYTPEVISRIVSNLRGNLYNVRTCLMLAEKALPGLEKAARIDTLAQLLVMATRDHNREARDTIHLEYAYLVSHHLEANRRSGGILPLSAILYDVRPHLLVESAE